MDFPHTLAELQHGIDTRLQLGAQVAIFRDGDIIADLAVGERAPGAPMTTQTILPWMSCTKPVTAVAVALLQEAGRLDWDQPVAEILPEFATHGKERLSIRHLLTHTCGLRILSARLDELDWDESIAAICAMPMEKDWIPGHSAGYHVATSFYLLGEIVRRLDGRSLDRFVDDEIFFPLDMSRCALIARAPDADVGGFFRTDASEPRPAMDRSGGSSRCPLRPGASGRGPANELVRFIQMMLGRGEWQGRRVLNPRTVDTLLHRHREGLLDLTFGKTIDWGLGFMLDSKRHQRDYPYSFGPHCSGDTFGHNGNQCSAAYGDPRHELAVAFIFNGQPGDDKHNVRLNRINAAIYRDLGLD